MREEVLHHGCAFAFVGQIDGASEPIVAAPLLVQGTGDEHVGLRLVADVHPAIGEGEMLMAEEQLLDGGTIVLGSRFERIGAGGAGFAVCVGQGKKKSIRQ